MAKAAIVSNSQTEAQKKKDAAIGAGVVRLAVSLQNGIKFTQIHSAPEGYVVLPSVNSDIKNNPNRAGILLDAGASVCVTVPKDQWDEVKAKYSSAHCFTADPPFVRELKSEADYKAMQDELSEVRTGGEPNTKEELDNAKGK